MHNHILPAVKCNRTLWLGTRVLKSVNVPTMSAHKLTLAIISVVGAAVLASCDSMSSDFANLSNSFSPPTPAQAAQWALDPYDAENQRRGTVLLANAPWGGSPAYLSMYRLYVEDNADPLVKASALDALARHGEVSDAELISKQLQNKNIQVKVAAAKALQRIHDPQVTAILCSRGTDEGEDASVRIEVAIALGQYAADDSFQALCTMIDQRELAVNLAANDSLRLLTDHDFALDRRLWLSWYRADKKPFRKELQYLYPTYQREKGFWDYITFWAPLTFEKPGVPVGMDESKLAPSTAPEDFQNLGNTK